MLHRTGLESLPCALRLLPAWRFSFALVCPLGNICASSSTSSGQKISFSFLFAQDFRKRDPSLVRRALNFPKGMGDVIAVDTAVPDRYKTHLQGMENMQKWLRYSYSFQYTFPFPPFFAGGHYAKLLSCLRQCEHLSSTSVGHAQRGRIWLYKLLPSSVMSFLW